MWLVIRMFSLQESRKKWVLLERKPCKELSHLASWGSAQAGPSPTERKKGQWISKWPWANVVQRHLCCQTLWSSLKAVVLIYLLDIGNVATWKELWFQSVLSPKGKEKTTGKIPLNCLHPFKERDLVCPMKHQWDQKPEGQKGTWEEHLVLWCTFPTVSW